MVTFLLLKLTDNMNKNRRYYHFIRDVSSNLSLTRIVFIDDYILNRGPCWRKIFTYFFRTNQCYLFEKNKSSNIKIRLYHSYKYYKLIIQ